jgi:hypothetical protein
MKMVMFEIMINFINRSSTLIKIIIGRYSLAIMILNVVFEAPEFSN